MKKKEDPFFKALILSPFCYTTANKTRHIRIADILADEEESGTDGYDCVPEFNMDGFTPSPNGDEGFMALQCSSPRRIISRWLSSLKRCRRRKRGGARSQKREKEVGRRDVGGGDESTHATCSMNCVTGAEEKESGVFVKDTSSFNFGVACGLIYLIVASKNELKKMVELRTEMELLLENAKEGLQIKNAPFEAKALEMNEMNLASSTTDLQLASTLSSGSRFSLQSGVVREVCSEYVRTGEVEMDRLEAELEVELERLQLHLDSETNSSNSIYPPQQRLKAVKDDISTSEEVTDEPADYDYNEMPYDYGVPALELERKLHELLEARQEERIKELEVSLEYAKRKLHEKEIEVSWWKESATTALVSHYDPYPSSSVASQHNSESTLSHV